MVIRWKTFTAISIYCCLQHSLTVTANAVHADPVAIQVKDLEQASQLSQRNPSTNRNISIVGNDFVIGGQVTRIMSGSLHYFRLPAAYWQDRLQKIKDAGLNSVSTYVEWSFHQPEESQELFDGDHDIVRFVQLAAEIGLHVLLRPGPYICAERDLGGLPYWLLSKYPSIKLRSVDPDFIKETKVWMDKLFLRLKPFLFGYGGPIILVQVENEYGSYSSDKKYMEKVRDILRTHTANKALLYTTDGPTKSYFEDGAVPGALTTIDFGAGYDVASLARGLRKFMPEGPLMNSEFYPGWLTHWGEQIQQVSTTAVVKALDDMLKNNFNFNFYVFFGGTNFEFTAGANYGRFYQPDITSYDYDAPLTEAGDPTEKYYAIRDKLRKYLGLEEKPGPEPSKKGAYGLVTMRAKTRIFSSEGRSSLGKTYSKVTGSNLPTFEKLRQRSGLVLYETVLNDNNNILKIDKPRDWIYVYVDYKLRGVIHRLQNSVFSLSLNTKPGSILSLLVENQGRINFGSKIHDYKGIRSNVVYGNNILNGPWNITGYPLEKIEVKQGELVTPNLMEGPKLYEGQMHLPVGEQPLDTFLDLTGWGKGYVWINGHNLGRYWPGLGPQVTLYVPGVWLQPAPAPNIIQILELQEAPQNLSIEFIDHPILNRTGSHY